MDLHTLKSLKCIRPIATLADCNRVPFDAVNIKRVSDADPEYGVIITVADHANHHVMDMVDVITPYTDAIGWLSEEPALAAASQHFDLGFTSVAGKNYAYVRDGKLKFCIKYARFAGDTVPISELQELFFDLQAAYAAGNGYGDCTQAEVEEALHQIAFHFYKDTTNL